MTGGASPSFRILVVDDEPFSRKVIARLFESLGALHVVFAGSGAEARAAMEADPALSLVISDHYMPDENGLRLLGDLRQGRLPLPHDTYFVVATVSTSFALTAVALALDADSFMSKPFGKEKLATRLFQFLSKDATRAIKPVEHYAAIDVAGMLAAAERLDPAAPAHAPPVRQIPMTKLRRVLPGTVLAADLIAADGATLLREGTQLTRHLIERLEELGVEMVPAAPSIVGADERSRSR
ncbi:response regulator [Magnetospirillum fulvum]|uniref:Response regulator receiver domain-containing protein n=1 Tax=Magnetospirillum fulvum TaxID=1082 RepID=A0A1H6HGG9_MAGFU|nr:response regulator [Magnetospirillum fulvum]SEH34919.1 Response regulator receiver domain-containing protein [Magnetospirillum fulvum]